jgi:hypothetical protein
MDPHPLSLWHKVSRRREATALASGKAVYGGKAILSDLCVERSCIKNIDHMA